MLVTYNRALEIASACALQANNSLQPKTFACGTYIKQVLAILTSILIFKSIPNTCCNNSWNDQKQNALIQVQATIRSFKANLITVPIISDIRLLG